MVSTDSSLQNLEKVAGKSDGNLNNLLFSKAAGQSTGLVVYFGGDGTHGSNLLLWSQP
jgi:hypothetical protein